MKLYLARDKNGEAVGLFYGRPTFQLGEWWHRKSGRQLAMWRYPHLAASRLPSLKPGECIEVQIVPAVPQAMKQKAEVQT